LSVNKEAILLVGFNRPEFLEARLNEISSFSCKNLYIAIDGPRVNYHDEVAHEQIMKNLEIWKNKIKFVEIISKNNIGLALNITNAVSTILKNNQKVLIIEDDVSLQKPAFESILRNEALDLSCVATVGGFGFMAKPKFFSEFTKNSFRLTPFFCAWGWSINREKWKNYSLDLSNLNIEKELKHSKIWNSLTEKDKIIWEFRFKKVKSNPFYTWDTQMQFMTFKYDLYNVLPFYRLLDNVGFDDNRSTNTKDRKPNWYIGNFITYDKTNMKLTKFGFLVDFWKILDRVTWIGTIKLKKTRIISKFFRKFFYKL